MESSTSGGFNSQTSLEKREIFLHEQIDIYNNVVGQRLKKTQKSKNLPSVYVVNHIWSSIWIMKNLKLKKESVIEEFKNKGSILMCIYGLIKFQEIQELV